MKTKEKKKKKTFGNVVLGPVGPHDIATRTMLFLKQLQLMTRKVKVKETLPTRVILKKLGDKMWLVPLAW